MVANGAKGVTEPAAPHSRHPVQALWLWTAAIASVWVFCLSAAGVAVAPFFFAHDDDRKQVLVRELARACGGDSACAPRCAALARCAACRCFSSFNRSMLALRGCDRVVPENGGAGALGLSGAPPSPEAALLGLPVGDATATAAAIQDR